ncbi:LysR family transcriptional regulator [Xanthomonas oryzae pv. oryzicola]|nr:LysR family transcriptional regulator [Xanthomonas oryzae pv. oryzicola]
MPAQRLLLHEEALALIVAPGHRFATRKRVALAELDDEPIAGAGVRGILDAAFAQAGLRQRQQYEVTHADLVRELVAADLGVGIIP